MSDRHRSPLHDRHRELGGRLIAFAGWEMPLEFAGGGVVKEHTAVREAVGVFDVSHLGKARLRGPGARAFVNRTLTNDLDRIGPGQAQYTLCCDDASGGVVDDLIAYVFADDHVFLVPNAANTAEVVRRLRADAPAEISITNEHLDHAIIAVQGPRSADLLDRLALPTQHDYMSFRPAEHQGRPLVVCRTGYTGEHGYELVIPRDGAVAVWDALFAAGADLGVRPAGLGARDTLRTEMGYPLHGQDLSLEITPVQARLGWAVGWAKPAFWGRTVLTAERAAGPRRTSWGLEALDRAIPRPHMVVRTPGGEPVGTPVGSSVGPSVGTVTSGTFSPTRRVGIGLALIATTAGLGAGSEVEVDIRGRPARMRLVKPPFVTPSVR